MVVVLQGLAAGQPYQPFQADQSFQADQAWPEAVGLELSLGAAAGY